MSNGILTGLWEFISGDDVNMKKQKGFQTGDSSWKTLPVAQEMAESEGRRERGREEREMGRQGSVGGLGH